MRIHFVERPYDEFINVFATPKATNLAAHKKVTGSTTHENIIDLDLPTERLDAAAKELKGLLAGKSEEHMYAPLVRPFIGSLLKRSQFILCSARRSMQLPLPIPLRNTCSRMCPIIPSLARTT